MPEQLLGLIVRACSNRGDLVLDPFGGSGTPLVMAKKLRRHDPGFELSSDDAAAIHRAGDRGGDGAPSDKRIPIRFAPIGPRSWGEAHPDTRGPGGPLSERAPAGDRAGRAGSDRGPELLAEREGESQGPRIR
jgi:hypothetical protein